MTIQLGTIMFPILPESFTVTKEGNGGIYRLADGEEISYTAKGGRKKFSFSGFFPKTVSAETCAQIEEHVEKGDVLSFSVFGGNYPVSLFVTIATFSVTERAGEEGVSFSLTLTEHRGKSLSDRQTGDRLSAAGAVRQEEEKKEESVILYTVKAGDTLWAIAKRYLGDGSRYPEIASDNNIQNPNLIFPGQEVRIRIC